MRIKSSIGRKKLNDVIIDLFSKNKMDLFLNKNSFVAPNYIKEPSITYKKI
jgi:hypothetical protein